MKALAVSIYHFSFLIFHLPSPAFISLGSMKESWKPMTNEKWKMVYGK